MIKGLSERKSLRQRVRFLLALFPDLDLMKVVDVGANPVHTPPYAPLLANNGCQVVGFEPQKEAFDRLQANLGENESYVNAAVGKKGNATLNIYPGGGFTSLFKLHEPSLRFLSRFVRQLSGATTMQVELSGLDEIKGVPDIDFLKMDVQGAEVDILLSGKNKLKDAVVVIPEVRFYRLYESEPLLGDLDVVLRKQGFELHKFLDSKHVQLRNSQTKRLNARDVRNQLVDGDAVYIRNMENIDNLSDAQLFYMALSAGTVFDSQDLALRCLDHLVQRKVIQTNVPRKYANLLPDRYFSDQEIETRDARLGENV